MDLTGLTQYAREHGVHRNSIENRRLGDKNFPAPHGRVGNTLVWKSLDLDAYFGKYPLGKRGSKRTTRELLEETHDKVTRIENLIEEYIRLRKEGKLCNEGQS